MKKSVLKILSLVVTLILLVSFIGCSKNTSGNNSESTQQKTEQATVIETTQEPAADPFGKYEPAIAVDVAQSLESVVKFKQGESIDNNDWVKAYEAELGIKLNYLWTVPAAQYDTKINITVAANNLPDFLPVKLNQVIELQQAGMIEDLTEAFEKYASPVVKGFAEEDQEPMKLVTIDNKLMAIPFLGSGSENTANMMLMRSDWLKNLNLQQPKNMDELLNIIKAFATQDPDMNGKNDTYGLAMSKELYVVNGITDIAGFFNAYHAYPYIWVEDASGKLAYGSIQPEIKTVLAKLQELYKAGYIDKEFVVKDRLAVGADVKKGLIGMNFCQAATAKWVGDALFKDNLEADLAVLPLVSADNKPALAQVNSDANTRIYYIVKKGMKNPEALVKLLNLAVEKLYGKDVIVENIEKYFFPSDGQTNPYHYIFAMGYPSHKNVKWSNSVTEVVQSPSKLNTEQDPILKKDVSEVLDYLNNGNRNMKGKTLQWYSDNSAFGVINTYLKNNLLMINKFASIPTPSMLEKQSSLQKLEIEEFTKIIMGDPVENFDKFISNWKQLGGDAITEEVNNWYAAYKK